MNRRVVIGTRGSKLALWQAEWVKARLEELHPGIAVELSIIKTTGDKILDVPLAKVGGKGLFVKEIEEALSQGSVDIAVHSMKDVPVLFPADLHLPVICEREDPRDAFITQIQNSKFKIQNFGELPQGATIGTSSLRRSCQLLRMRPDLRIEQLRGNLDTRLRKLDEGKFDAIILAAAGVRRLGWSNRITETLQPDVSLPAIGQGAIGIECRIADEETNALIAPLNHVPTATCVLAERALLKKLEGGCQVPIAAYATIQKSKLKEHNSGNDTLVLEGLVGSISGEVIIRERIEGSASDAESLGIALAGRLLGLGAKKILDEVYRSGIPSLDENVAT